MQASTTDQALYEALEKLGGVMENVSDVLRATERSGDAVNTKLCRNTLRLVEASASCIRRAQYLAVTAQAYQRDKHENGQHHKGLTR